MPGPTQWQWRRQVTDRTLPSGRSRHRGRWPSPSLQVKCQSSVAREFQREQSSGEDLVGVDANLLIDSLPGTRLPEFVDAKRDDRDTPG